MFDKQMPSKELYVIRPTNGYTEVEQNEDNNYP